ncbi:hypothetical protein BGZ79_004154 [Entomortierella chlamydospora]|nr:hypothetical protein BGZ79_004154 [Entomortierella chlamydospora]
MSNPGSSSTSSIPQVSQAQATAIMNQAVDTITARNKQGQQAPGRPSVIFADQDGDAEMGGGPTPVGPPTLEELIAQLNARIGKGNASLDPGSYLPSFKKGVLTDKVVADVLNKFINRAAVLLDKIRMAEKVLRELNAHRQLGYWGHHVVNANRVTLSKEASTALAAKYDEFLVEAIKSDKVQVIAKCNQEIESTLPKAFNDTLCASLLSIETNEHINAAGKDFTYKLMRAAANEFTAQVQALRVTAELQRLNLGLKNQKKVTPSKNGKGKTPPSRRTSELSKFKGPKGPAKGKNGKKSGPPNKTSNKNKTPPMQKKGRGKGPVKGARSQSKK